MEVPTGTPRSSPTESRWREEKVYASAVADSAALTPAVDAGEAVATVGLDDLAGLREL
jgi:hypothetical protein